MEWILQHVVQLVTVVFVVVSIVRAIRQSREAQERHEDETIESEEERRTREIQENIRRKIAERRGGRPAPAADETFHRGEESSREIRPSPQASPLPPGPLGDLGRVFEQLGRRIPQAEPPRLQQVNRAEVERQAQLAEQLRLAEEAKVIAARRAAHQTQERMAALQSEAALRSAARARLLGDLRDPQSVQRAFVLREVLGPPVGLR